MGLPPHRWATLYLGTVVLLSVYYLNYGAGFEEGDIDGGNPLTLPLRLSAVGLIVWSLRPFRLRFDATAVLVGLYVLCGLSLLLAVGTYGAMNDALFLNTLIQLPILSAFIGTVWRFDYGRWFRFAGMCLLVQAAVDAAVLLSDASLWLSQAFVGGVGNPSSFGLGCVLLFAFYMLHPDAGRMRFPMALAMAAAAVMSKALFAILAVALVWLFWAAHGWRRMLFSAGLILGMVLVLGLPVLVDEEGPGFLANKLSAAGALLGFLEYDVDSSASVYLRLQMHDWTFAALDADPWAALLGHLEGKPYWPMDSQVLSYLGSFGAVPALIFLILHCTWMVLANRYRDKDGAFTLVALSLFGLIFLTNRILDYFPVAAFYFVTISMPYVHWAKQRQRREHHASAAYARA